MKKSGNVAPAKGAPDKPKKKLTPAEQAKLDEELALRAMKRAEENKKFGIKMALDDFPLILTEDFLKQAWESPKPREYVYDYLTHQFDRLGILYLTKPEEQRMYANQILMDLIFIKQDFGSETAEKHCLLSNLLFANFTNKDLRFQIEYPQIRDTPFENEEEEEAWLNQEQARRSKLPELEDSVEPDDYRSALDVTSYIADKSYGSDLSDFKVRLGRVMKQYPHHFIKKEEIPVFVNHAMSSYFANHNLFRYTSYFTRSEENISLQVAVDEPTTVLPLTAAVQTGKLEAEDDDAAAKDNREEDARKAMEQEIEDAEKRAKEEEERKKLEEWMGLDDKTIAIIQDRIAKTKEYMVKRIESKKEEYNEKLTAAKVQIKKK